MDENYARLVAVLERFEANEAKRLDDRMTRDVRALLATLRTGDTIFVVAETPDPGEVMHAMLLRNLETTKAMQDGEGERISFMEKSARVLLENFASVYVYMRPGHRLTWMKNDGELKQQVQSVLSQAALSTMDKEDERTANWWRGCYIYAMPSGQKLGCY